MRSAIFFLFLLWVAVGMAVAQDEKSSSGKTSSAERNVEAQESSSRDTKIDISPPKDDAKNHPHSRSAIEATEERPSTDDVQEFHPWNPMKALKDVEVGDFYFKRKNYRAALDRYKEALFYKQNDAVATFRVAQCQEKLGDIAAARTNYEAYLRILPEGPFAADAQKALDRLTGEPSAKKN